MTPEVAIPFPLAAVEKSPLPFSKTHHLSAVFGLRFERGKACCVCVCVSLCEFVCVCVCVCVD